MAGSVLGRTDEMARLDAFFTRVEDGDAPDIAVVEGEAGIGKTSLLAAAKAGAQERALLVLAAQPVESEMPLEFSTLADLLAPIGAEHFDALPAPQRNALRGVLLHEVPDAEPPSPRAVAVATLGLLESVSGTRPVVMIVDDLPWLDPSSAAVLAFVARRIDGLRAGLIGSVRTGWAGRDRSELIADLPDGRVERIPLDALDLDTTSAVLAAHGIDTIDRVRLRRIFETSRGNPLFALQLAASIDTAEHVPTSVGEMVAERLARIPERVRQVLLLCALAAVPTLGLVTSAAGDPSAVLADVDSASEAGLISADGERIAFVHPLVRAAVAENAGPASRRAAHRSLADAVPTPEERARHLALAAEGPDENVARIVASAATVAERLGAPESAGELAELAARLTPSSDQPARHRRLLHAAHCRFAACDPHRAMSLAEAVIAEMEPGPERARAYLRLESYMRYAGIPARLWIAPLEAALDDAGDDVQLEAAVRLALGFARANAGDLEGSNVEYRSALALADHLDDAALTTRTAGLCVFLDVARGVGADRDAVARALAPAVQPSNIEIGARPRFAIAHALSWTDDLEAARALFESEYEWTQTTGTEIGLPILCAGYVQLELAAGRWDHAEVLADRGYEAAVSANSPAAEGMVLAMRSWIHGCRGRLDEARADAARAFELAARTEVALIPLFTSQGLGLGALSVGDWAGCHEQLGPFAAMAHATAVPEPGLYRFVPDEVEALVRLNHVDEAERLVDVYERRAFELGRTSAVAMAARCRGLLLAARGELDAALAALDEAFAAHDRVAMPFDRARTLLVAGEVNRRARRRRVAVDVLHEARSVFDALGAPLWVARTDAELELAGSAWRGAGNELSDIERRVAELAASGRTNREVAGELFIAVRTVEFHLTNAYRKLTIQSRRELRGALGNTTTQS